LKNHSVRWAIVGLDKDMRRHIGRGRPRKGMKWKFLKDTYGYYRGAQLLGRDGKTGIEGSSLGVKRTRREGKRFYKSKKVKVKLK